MNNSLSKKKHIRRISSYVIIFLVIFSLLLVVGTGIMRRRPNVILIVCDTLRADHLGCYGYKRGTTKNIDLLANDACIFKNAYSQAPSTRPSMWNIATSKYNSPVPAEDGLVTIAEYFKSKGYITAAFISQHFLGVESNLQQGFDVYDPGSARDKHGMPLRRAEDITGAAIEWIRARKKNPFFIWLVYFDPHDPYDPPDIFKGYYTGAEKFNRDRRDEKIQHRAKAIPEGHRQFLINAYDEEIRYFDYAVGRLFSHLKHSGLYSNTIIIVTSDHGEELGDNGDLWSHSLLLSQEEIRVPLLIKMPGRNKKIVREDTVQTIDLYPTLVEYLDKTRLPGYYNTLEGRSLMPLLNKGRLDRDRFAASFWYKQRSILIGDYKYWVKPDGECFVNIKTNAEITDVKIRDKLKNLLEKVANAYSANEGYSKATIDHLKSIGYLQ